MMLQGEFGEGEEEGFTPSGVEGRIHVEEQWYEGADVLHGNSLGMQVEERRGLVLKKGCVERRGPDTGAMGFRIRCGGGVIVGVRGRHGRRAFASGALQGVADAGVSDVALLLRDDSLAFGISRASQGGDASSLRRALAIFLGSAQGGSALRVRSGISDVGIRGYGGPWVDGFNAGGVVWRRQRVASHGAAPEDRRAGRKRVGVDLNS
ncbi:hypothetical protein GUJ93_ZPchr0014g47175 [Zizania palustris]|uniref:Uncharacterized protein n=1 Tax=Zizania palustris TaxID=103762 RepID=A0A8J5SUK1_ZIZPA|nr:hypothetical protein GUJ93_ZPchr0014g47175 [Zizania palustris]